MPVTLSSLPHDVLLYCADYLDSERDINAFALISRHFYLHLNDYLYGSNAIWSESSAILWAARLGQLDTAAHSIEQGGDVNAKWIASYHSWPRYGSRRSPDRDIIGLLEGNKCYFCTPIYAAVLCGYPEMVDLLVSHGADTEQSLDSWGSPLQAAVQYGRLPIAQHLLAQCQDVDKPSHYKGRTALHTACVAAHDRVVYSLLEAGADVNAQDEELDTPLHLAYRRGDRLTIPRHRTIQWLLVSGADKGSRNRRGMAPPERSNGTACLVELSKSGLMPVYEVDDSEPALLQRLWAYYLEISTE